MRIFSKTKDGGPGSPVTAFFLFEFKKFGSVALLRFNQGGRESFHTHAFKAWTWFLTGSMVEEKIVGEFKPYQRSLFPKHTPRENNHRVLALTTSWCFTIRGPWVDEWTEDHPKTGERTVFTHGRVVKEVSRGDNNIIS